MVLLLMRATSIPPFFINVIEKMRFILENKKKKKSGVTD
jgi:hypothetical protein